MGAHARLPRLRLRPASGRRALLSRQRQFAPATGAPTAVRSHFLEFLNLTIAMVSYALGPGVRSGSDV